MAVLYASTTFKRRPKKKTTYNHPIVPLSHQRSLISALSLSQVVRYLDSIISLLAIAEILRP